MSQAGDGDQVVTLLGVGVDVHSGAPLMLLGETANPRRAIPIWIGPVEAREIRHLTSGPRPPRPLTHQLLVDTVAALGQRITQITIRDLDDGLFRAEVMLSTGARVDARPGDAVPVALAAGAPIYVAAVVLAAAAVPIRDLDAAVADPDPPDPGAGPGAEEIDAQARELRSWLDTASPDDFDTGPGDNPPG